MQKLALGATRVSDSGLAQLKGMKGLQELDLAHTNVTDDGLAQLKSMTGLRTLDLSETKISDAGFEYLAEYDGPAGALSQEDQGNGRRVGMPEGHARDLEELYLAGTRVTPAGLACLKCSPAQHADFQIAAGRHACRESRPIALRCVPENAAWPTGSIHAAAWLEVQFGQQLRTEMPMRVRSRER